MRARFPAGVQALAAVWAAACLAAVGADDKAVAKPQKQLRVRQPSVQGAFYPADKEKLTQQVDAFLAQKPAATVSGRIRALVAPHAGYRFSGAVAGEGFSQIPTDVNRVIIMAPAHRVAMRGGGSILDVDAYRNALGDVPIDPAAAELRRKHEFFGSFPQAHAQEHSLEVMLPFLQRRLKSFTIIPIVLGHGFDATAMARALAPLTEDEKTLVVASSDLSHGKPYEEANRLDRDCLSAMLGMNAGALQSKELCGKAPVSVLLLLANLRRWQAKLIDYKNSGDTTGNQKGRIVGYGCVAFTQAETKEASDVTREKDETAAEEAQPKEEKKKAGITQMPADYEGELLSSGEQTLLLDLARRSIVARLNGEELPKLPMYSETLTQNMGCFVTLHKKGRLRGCIGNILPVYPLVQAIQRNALSAAFEDRRFDKVEAPEMKDIEVEISVLTVPKPLKYQDAADLLRQLKAGVHGVVLSQGAQRRSTYLPQVWEQIPDKTQFLSYLCRKGGMPVNAWRDPSKTKVEVYEAFAFEEE